jgi:predicted MFS family arabinose efflux permease
MLNMIKRHLPWKISVDLRFLAIAIVLLLLVLSMNAVLMVNVLKHLYVESVASQYSVFGGHLRRNLEKAILFGKPLRKFVGMDSMLEEAKQNILKKSPVQDTPPSEAAVSVSIALPEDWILYSTDEKLVSTILPEQLRRADEVPNDDNNVAREFQYVKYQEQFIVTLPVYDMTKNWVATVMITFDHTQVNAFLKTVVNDSMIILLVIFVCNIVFLIPFLNFLLPGSTNGKKHPKLRFVLVMIIVMLVSQLVFWGVSVNSFKNYYLQINMDKADTLTALLKEDIEYLLDKGVPINQLTNIEGMMAEIIAAFPELQSMTILDNGRNPLYIATSTEVFDFRKTTEDQLKLVSTLMPVFDREYNRSLELRGSEGRIEGYISVNLSKKGILSAMISKGSHFAKIFKIAFGFTFVLLVLLPLLYELLAHTKIRLVASALVVLILALGFNALLNLNSLEKLYVGSIASQYKTLGKTLQQDLEKALFFEKPLHKFVGMNTLLEETKRDILKVRFNGISTETEAKTLSSADVSVSIALPDGSILYSTEETLIRTTLPEHVKTTCEDFEQKGRVFRNSRYVKSQNMYFIPLPIHDISQRWVASVIITFNGQQIQNFLNTVRNNNIKMIAIILGCSAILLILLLHFVTLRGVNFSKSPKLKIALIMLLVVGSAQIGFSGLNAYEFRNYYLQINEQKAKMLTTLIKEDIEFLFSKGVSINKLVKMDVVMREFIEVSPELSDIILLNNKEIPLYMAAKESLFDFQQASAEQRELVHGLLSTSDPRYNFRLEVLRGDHIEGYISTNLSKDVISARIFDIVLDSATVLAISLLFFGELLFLIFVYIERELISTEESEIPHHYGAIRPAAFLFLFGSSVSVSFLPLYMATLYNPIFNLSKDIVMGLPISIKMFFTGLSIVFAGTWLDRRGWHEPFLSGLALTGLGLVYSWLAPDMLHFIISRGIVGLGYGFSLMACQGFVIANTDKNNRTQGLTQLFAGVFAGSICGGATGGMLAERIGYRAVFFLGAVLVFSVIGYTIVFMRNTIRKMTPQMAKQRRQPVNPRQIWGFLLNRSVFPLILFASFPAALAIVGFLNYFSPIYLDQIGISESNIGRILMIHGICLIYFAPFISKYIDVSSNKKKYIFINCFVGSLAFILFYFLKGISASIAAVLLLGLSDSFSDSRSSYILKLKVTQELGTGKAMGLFSSVARIGQVLGPVTFAWLIVTTGINKSILYIGCAYLLMAVLFFLFTPDDGKLEVAEN